MTEPREALAAHCGTCGADLSNYPVNATGHICGGGITRKQHSYYAPGLAEPGLPMTGPRTAAGRALLEREDLNERSFPLITLDAILAIEAEAAAGVHIGDEGLRSELMEGIEAFAYGVLLTLTTPSEAQRLAAAIREEASR